MLERHRTHENDENDPKKGPRDTSTTCLLGPGMYVVFLLFFFLLLMFIYRYTTSTSTVTTNGDQNDNDDGDESWQRERPKNGVQTTKQSFVVCALGSRRIYDASWARCHVKKKWPKRRQTRRLGHMYVFFSIFFSYFSILINIHRLSTFWRREGSQDNENGPKRRQTRCLGHRYVLFFLIVFSVL
jgi:hypothetical protein